MQRCTQGVFRPPVGRNHLLLPALPAQLQRLQPLLLCYANKPFDWHVPPAAIRDGLIPKVDNVKNKTVALPALSALDVPVVTLPLLILGLVPELGHGGLSLVVLRPTGGGRHRFDHLRLLHVVL